jgi:hypothetical protein
MDLLEVMHRLMLQFPDKQKIGIGLRVDDLPDHFPLKASVVKWETSLIGKRLDSLAVEAPVDTTFALYKKDRWHLENSVGFSMRTAAPYMARHLPWYVDHDHLDEEEKYYMTSASSASSYASVLSHNQSRAKEDSSGGSYLPVLLPCVKATKGPVLELGMSDYCTPALHDLCSGRLLMSVERDADWVKRFQHLIGGMHKVATVFNWNDPWYFYDWEWDIVLINSWVPPAFAMNKLAHKAKFIIADVVAHDWGVGCSLVDDEMLSKFKYICNFKKLSPNTSIVSNFLNPAVEFKGLLP